MTSTEQLERSVAKICAIELSLLVSPVLGQASLKWLAQCMNPAGIELVSGHGIAEAQDRQKAAGASGQIDAWNGEGKVSLTSGQDMLLCSPIAASVLG